MEKISLNNKILFYTLIKKNEIKIKVERKGIYTIY